jgi:Holliday junction resolvasome RuvABC endonuclease subunit
MPNKEPLRLIALDPSTREIGYAVFHNQDLIRCGVKTLWRSKHGFQHLADEAIWIVRQLITSFGPTVVALEQLLPIQQRSLALVQLYQLLKTAIQHERLLLYEYTGTVARRYLCPSGKATKQMVSKQLITLYPELSWYICEESKWKQDYYSYLFSAVALGYYVSERLLKEQSIALKNVTVSSPSLAHVSTIAN